MAPATGDKKHHPYLPRIESRQDFSTRQPVPFDPPKGAHIRGIKLFSLSPGLNHPLGDPEWGPNLISFSFNVPLEKSFLTFNLLPKIGIFETSYFFITRCWSY